MDCYSFCRPIAVGAASSSVICSILIFTVTVGEYISDTSTAIRSAPTLRSLFLGFSAVSFALGGSAVFPSMQKDMKSPEKFEKALLYGFSGKA